jgi:hypothetical protein
MVGGVLDNSCSCGVLSVQIYDGSVYILLLIRNASVVLETRVRRIFGMTHRFIASGSRKRALVTQSYQSQLLFCGW